MSTNKFSSTTLKDEASSPNDSWKIVLASIEEHKKYVLRSLDHSYTLETAVFLEKDGCEQECGELHIKPHAHRFFNPDEIEEMLDFDELTSDYWFRLATRAIYFFNKEGNSSPLLLRPMDVYLSKKTNYNDMKLPDGLKIEAEKPVGFLLLSNLYHTVSVRVTFSSASSNSESKHSMSTEVFDSYYHPEDTQITNPSIKCLQTPRCVDIDSEDFYFEDSDEEEEEENEIYHYDISKQEAFYSSLLKSSILPLLQQKLHSKEVIWEESFKLKNSVLFQEHYKGVNDYNDGIHSMLSMLSMMIGKDPSSGIEGIQREFRDAKRYRECFMLLVAITVAHYFIRAGVKYCHYNRESGWLDMKKCYGYVRDDVVFLSNLAKLNLKLKSMKVDFGKALGPELFALFDFLPRDVFVNAGQH